MERVVAEAIEQNYDLAIRLARGVARNNGWRWNADVMSRVDEAVVIVALRWDRRRPFSDELRLRLPRRMFDVFRAELGRTRQGGKYKFKPEPIPIKVTEDRHLIGTSWVEHLNVTAIAVQQSLDPIDADIVLSHALYDEPLHQIGRRHGLSESGTSLRRTKAHRVLRRKLS